MCKLVKSNVFFLLFSAVWTQKDRRKTILPLYYFWWRERCHSVLWKKAQGKTRHFFLEALFYVMSLSFNMVCFGIELEEKRVCCLRQPLEEITWYLLKLLLYYFVVVVFFSFVCLSILYLFENNTFSFTYIALFSSSLELLSFSLFYMDQNLFIFFSSLFSGLLEFTSKPREWDAQTS